MVASYAATDIRLLTPEENKAKERLRLIGKAREVKKKQAKGNLAKAADLAEQVGRLHVEIWELGKEE